MTTYEQARRYIENGISVIPLPPKSKKVVIKWAKYMKTLATHAEIAEWFENTDNNIGIVTGALSNLTVVDCDSPEAVELARKKGLLDTVTVKTGRGMHFYFRYAKGTRNFQSRADLPGIDLRSEGGYVVAPPSIHPDGTKYERVGKIMGYAEFPEGIFDKTDEDTPGGDFKNHNGLGVVGGHKSGYSETSARKGRPLPHISKRISNASAYLAKIPGSISGEGGHQDTWGAAIKIFKGFALPIEVAIDLLTREYNPRCSPPWTEKELRHKVSDASKSMVQEGFMFDPSGLPGHESARVRAMPEKEAAKIVDVLSLEKAFRHAYEFGVDSGHKTGWEVLDEFYTVRKGEMTILTGLPGSGKTTFLDALMVNLSLNQNWKFGLFSAENIPFDRHLAVLAEQYTGLPSRKGPTARMKPVHITASIEYLNDHFKFVDPHEDNCTVPSILNGFSQIKDTSGLDAVVIDPWNEIDHSRPSWCTETEHISRMLSLIRRFARDKDIHIWVVAHPAKPKRNELGDYPIPTPYDISGGAHWRNKADNCITVWRDFKETTGRVEIHVQKIRFREIGKLGKADLYFNPINCRYYESEYELTRARLEGADG